MTDRPSPIAALGSVLLALVGMFIFNLLIGFLSARGAVFGNSIYAATLTFQGVVFAVPVLLYYHRFPEYTPALRIRGIDPLCAVLVVMAALVGMLALNWITVYWTLLLNSLGLVTNTGNSAAPRTPDQLVWMMASFAIAPALFEETLFRGFLLPSLEPVGSSRAVLICGCMFALMHGRIESLPAHLLLGSLLGLLVLRTDSLLAAILYHTVHNSAILLSAYSAATSNPAALEAIPSFAEALPHLPQAVALLGVWGLLGYTAMERGLKKQEDPLPAASKKPLSKAALGMLIGTAVLLVVMELRTLFSMLPGGAI